MNIEIVWLAFDEKSVGSAWSQMAVRDLYNYIINDNFRKRVDPRSMLFHSDQSDLLKDIESFMKRGAIDVSIENYLASMFYQGEEEFPLECGELKLDFRLISYFSSLRMADDYHMVENFFKRLFSKMKLYNGMDFSFFEIEDIFEFSNSLSQVTVSEIINLVESESDLEGDPEIYVRLVQNYIEFFNYAKNNNLKPFYYNDQTDITKWGNLIERQNERSSRIVNTAYKKVKKVLRTSVKKKEKLKDDKMPLISKLKHKRRIENLISGLRDYDSLIRQKAAEYLGTFGRIEDCEHLIEALDDPEPKVRQEVARALGEIGDKIAVKPLINRLLKDDSFGVVASCAQALSNIGDAQALLPLVEALTQGNYQLAVPIAFFPNLIKNSQAKKLLLLAAENNNVDIRRQVSFILGELKSKESVARLKKRLSDNDKEVQINAIFSLKRIGTREAISSLKNISLKSQDAEIKRMTQRALKTASA